MAASQVASGRWLRSKAVPTVTVNCLRHALHFRTPLRTGLVE